MLFDDAGTTMGTIADAITADYDLAGERRITRVVTFNADELLKDVTGAELEMAAVAERVSEDLS